MVAVRLACENIAEVHFHNGGGDGKQGIVNGDAGVAVASCVEDNAIGRKADFLKVVDNLALHIALEIADADVGITVAQR